jgi:polyhydroxyalkanoate synthesis regulator phasin
MRNRLQAPNARRIETPRQLGERYRQELADLVKQGEITPGFARQVMDDLFTPAEPGQAPELRPFVWRRYVAQLTRDFS